MKYIISICSIFGLLSGCEPKSGDHDKINVLELTISDIHDAYREDSYSSEDLVNSYLARIESYDKSSTLNSIIRINSEALDNARALDTEFQKSGRLRPLHGIPVIQGQLSDCGDSNNCRINCIKGFEVGI